MSALAGSEKFESSTMPLAGQDSDEVIEFMSLFARLKELSLEPYDLKKLTTKNPIIKELCIKLQFASESLRSAEKSRKKLFAAPVNPAFIDSWRSFEESYKDIITDIFLSDIDFLSDLPEIEDSNKASIIDGMWISAHLESSYLANSIDDAIEFASHNAQQQRWEDSKADFIQNILDGVSAWDRFKKSTNFDLHGVFRRRELVPFVLIPRHVAMNYGVEEKLSMLKNLQQAHDAFIFGAPLAALALMRSIMEAVLRDHYNAEGKNLEQRISNVSSRLPPASNTAALHRLRKLANSILHLEKEKFEPIPKMDEEQLEKEIVTLLFVLRALIEGSE